MYKKCLLGFAMPVLQEIPVRRYCPTQLILKVEIKPYKYGFCILEYESAFLFCNEANQMYIPSFSSDSNAMTCFDVMISCHDDKLICR